MHRIKNITTGGLADRGRSQLGNEDIQKTKDFCSLSHGLGGVSDSLKLLDILNEQLNFSACIFKQCGTSFNGLYGLIHIVNAVTVVPSKHFLKDGCSFWLPPC